MNANLAIDNSQSDSSSVAMPQESTQSRYTPDDEWEDDRDAEVALAAQRERVFCSSYLPASAGRFLIH
jgi:hypothetical protein